MLRNIILAIFAILTTCINSAHGEDFIYPVGNGGTKLDATYEYNQNGYATTVDEGYCSANIYAEYHECTGTWMYGHDGLDINSLDGDDCGNTVIASSDGEVIYSGEKGDWGNLVRISHTTSSGKYITHYAHLNAITVSYGQIVQQGEKIGEIGSTGNSSGCHLHFGAMTDENEFGKGYYFDSAFPYDTIIDPATLITAHSDESHNTSTNPTSSSELEDVLMTMENNDLHDLNPFSSYADGTSPKAKMGNTRDGDFHVWYDGDIEYDSDGVALDAWIQDYTGGGEDGAIICHEDAAYCVPIYKHMWKIWGLNTYDSTKINDNCGVDWFGSGYGPSSEFGLPISGTYYVDDSNRWRQDFQRGYITRNPDDDKVYLNCYANATPGWTDWGWDGEISAAIAEAYWRNGGKEIVGWAFDNGGGSTAHIWGGVVIQDFEGEVNGDNAIIVNLYNLEDSKTNRASVVRDGFWSYYKDHDGHLYYGAPLGDEMDTTQESSHNTYRGYDPYCDSNKSGWVSLAERQNCILEFCKDDRFDSMQRFEYVTICYADEWISDDYTIMGSTETETYMTVDGNPNQEETPVFMVWEADLGDWYWITSSGNDMNGSNAADPGEWTEKYNSYYYTPFYTDINGDSLPDLVTYQNLSGSWLVQLGDGYGGFTDDGVWRTGYGTSSDKDQYQAMLGDVDSDGLPDAIIYEPGYGYWYVAYNTGYSFTDTHYLVLSGWAKAKFAGQYQAWAADVTGDGVVEFVVWEPNYGYWYVAVNSDPSTDGAAYTNDGLWASGWALESSDGQYICDLADVDADGDVDVIAYDWAGGDHHVMTSNGSSFSGAGYFLENWAIASSSRKYVSYYVDVNFDEIVDLVVWEPNMGRWYVAPGTGTSFTASSTIWLEPGAKESYVGQYYPVPLME